MYYLSYIKSDSYKKIYPHIVYEGIVLITYCSNLIDTYCINLTEAETSV